MAPRNTALTIKQKLLLISLLKKKEKTKHQLAVEFKCDISTINRIIRNEAKIRELAESNKNVELKRFRKSSHADVEKALTIWYNQMRLHNAVISSKMVMNKAKEFAIQINSDFEPNSGWLWRWQRRENIKFTKIHRDSYENDPLEVDQNFMENSNVASILQNYTPENIFNADESGLFYKVLPSEILARKQSHKQRLTLLFVCNSTGTYKKVYAIGKYGNPHCFNGDDNLPVPYFSNKNAWMTNSLWMSILQEIDQEMVNENRKIVLFVDNASCHKITGYLQNINVQVIQPNTTSLIQPLEQGIIHSFKSNYRQIVIRKQKVSLEKGLQLQDFIKSITLLDALYYVKRSWRLVKENTIMNCFSKAGFPAHDPMFDEVHDNFIDITTGSYNFEEYVTCDENLQCYDDQIFNGLLDDNAESVSEDEVVVKEEPIIPSFKEALLAVDVLRQYFKYRNYDSDEIENLETTIFNNEIVPQDSNDAVRFLELELGQN